MVHLTAKKRVTYRRVTYLPGETFEATDKDAKILRAVGKAEPSDAQESIAKPQPKPIPRAPSKKAQPAAQRAPDVFPEPEAEPENENQSGESGDSSEENAE